MKKLFTLTAALLLMLSATVNAQDNVIKMKTKHAFSQMVTKLKLLVPTMTVATAHSK